MQDREGIHVNYVPRTFIPLANKANNCLMDREAQRHGHSSTGVDGIAMQDASSRKAWARSRIAPRSTFALPTPALS
jgi:phthalate 4,5-dioxygenase